MVQEGMARGDLGNQRMAPVKRFPAEVLASDNIVPVVLEFEQPPVAVYKYLNPGGNVSQYQDLLEAAHRDFLAKLASLGLDVQLGKSNVIVADSAGTATVSLAHDFTHVFNGIGVLMPGRVVAQAAQMAGVRTVTLNEERVYLTLDQSVPFTGATKVWDRMDANGIPIRGEGVVVAIIDTGIDWTHPEFGGFTRVPNEKVIHAVSFTGEQPMDDFGHGTHVAATVAGDASYKGTPRGDAQLNGMAPKAKLMGYKVLSASGSGSVTNIILAMEDAVKRGANVMNLSLGAAFGEPDAPESSAANNAMLAGVVVCVAAGNEGPDSASISAPGAAHHVITVGASSDVGVTVLVAQLVAEDGAARNVEMRLMEDSVQLPGPAIDAHFVACGMGLKPEEFPTETQGQIALIKRGQSTFREKALFAQKAGALAAVIYNNAQGNFYGTLGADTELPTIPVVSISMQDGELLLQAMKEGQKLSQAQLRLNPEGVPQPDHLAEFSSRGPNTDSWIKPELTAPGIDVRSATITQVSTPGNGMPDPSGYINSSGTSMATPHVSGAAALLRQAHPNWTPLQIKGALVNTARWMDGQGGIMDQGNGCMDLSKAIDCKAILVTAEETFNPTYSFGVVINEGQQKSVAKALTILQLDDEDTSTYRLAVEINGRPEGLKAELSAGTVGTDGKPTVGFDLTLTADGAKLPDGAYYGWVVAEADWGKLRLPFYYEAAVKAPESKPPKQSGSSGIVPPPHRQRPLPSDR